LPHFLERFHGTSIPLRPRTLHFRKIIFT
jgi:hypothetical protein